jgi:hypothetical protein
VINGHQVAEMLGKLEEFDHSLKKFRLDASRLQSVTMFSGCFILH